MTKIYGQVPTYRSQCESISALIPLPLERPFVMTCQHYGIIMDTDKSKSNRNRLVPKCFLGVLSENDLFNPNQHGFMKGKSCLSALLSVYDELINNLSNYQ